MKIRKMVTNYSIQVDMKYGQESEAANVAWKKLFGASGHDHFLDVDVQVNQSGVVIPLGEALEVLVPWHAIKFLIRDKEAPKK